MNYIQYLSLTRLFEIVPALTVIVTTCGNLAHYRESEKNFTGITRANAAKTWNLTSCLASPDNLPLPPVLDANTRVLNPDVYESVRSSCSVQHSIFIIRLWLFSFKLQA